MSQDSKINPKFNTNAIKFVSIDSGTNGAICECNYNTRELCLLKLNGLKPEELLPILDGVIDNINSVDCVVIEEPPRFMGTMIPSARIAVLFESFGIMIGYLMSKGIKVIRVSPREWQSRLNDVIGTRGKMKHSEWKKILTDYAKSRYTGTDNLTQQTADSLLIAEWWINEGIYKNHEKNTSKENTTKKKPKKVK
ncbi:MAG: hypothetical protein EB160_09870 [Nitrososphaeria archaeon]|nr:hypothetical protein [Nitrososphaeria archaeon]